MSTQSLNARIWILLSALILLPAAGLAQTVYVTEKFEITMRVGPGSERKIISLVQSGKALELLEEGEEWSRVRTPNDKEGWVLNRYITTETPSSIQLDKLQKENEALQAKYKELRNQYRELEAQTKSTEAALAASSKGGEQAIAAYETLKKESADFLKLKKKLEQAQADLDKEKNRSSALDKENTTIKRNQIIQWVWTGGGIMLVGFILGIFSTGKRKKRSSLY